MTALAGTPAPAVHLPVKTDPWPHQQRAFTFASDRNDVLFDIGMGGGKGLIAVALAEHRQAMRTLVICPRNVIGVWPDEIAAHARREWVVWNGTVQGARGPLKNPSGARRAASLVEAVRHAGVARRPLLAIVNYDACFRKPMRDVLLATRWDVVDLDESHKIKAPGGRASWLAKDIGFAARRHGGLIICQSGTPMPHSPLDIYAQARVLNPIYFGTSFEHFRIRYGRRAVLYRTCPECNSTKGIVPLEGNRYACNLCNWVGDELFEAPKTTPNGEQIWDGIRDDVIEEFAERLARFTFRVDEKELDEILGLEKPVDMYRTIPLDAETARVYADLEQDLVAEIDAGVITAANRMVLTTRLAQLSGGFAPLADDVTAEPRYVVNPPAKARLLAEVLDDIDAREPVVVFARFRADLDAIQSVAEQLGRRYGELSGRRRDGLTDNSKLNPDIDILGCQLQAGGVGIDFTRSAYFIYYSLNFDLGNHLQSRKRGHRPGQTRRVTYIHLVAEDTIDQAILNALSRRQDAITAVLDRLRQKGATP